MVNKTIEQLFLIFGSEILAFAVALALTPLFFKLARRFELRKQIRAEGLSGGTMFAEMHQKKEGTFTMGGVIIWMTVILVVLFSRVLSAFGIFKHSLLNRNETWLPVFALSVTAGLGLVDDWLNIKGIGGARGISAKIKFLWLTLFAILGAYWFHFRLGHDQIHLPFFGDLVIGKWYILLFIFVLIASANAVNITDGLDGLAGGLIVIAFSAFGVIAYSQQLLILAAFCAVVAGASMAFLWFNIYPAKFFMGDTGALSLGATLGVIAMLTDSIVPLIFIAFMPVIETLSVIIQLVSKKLFGKKVFLIAPIHHHFEKKGVSEPTIVMRFWILGAFFAAFGLILALLRVI